MRQVLCHDGHCYLDKESIPKDIANQMGFGPITYDDDYLPLNSERVKHSSKRGKQQGLGKRKPQKIEKQVGGRRKRKSRQASTSNLKPHTKKKVLKGGGRKKVVTKGKKKPAAKKTHKKSKKAPKPKKKKATKKRK